jgi:chemotaxis protein MotB
MTALRALSHDLMETQMSIRQLIFHTQDEESYFASMTDIVIGLLFIFIIMLMFFAMRFQQASTEKENITEKQKSLIEDLTDAEATRTNILENIKGLLKKEGIDVIVVRDEGILRLPEKLLFGPSSWDIRNTTAIRSLGNALNQVLPCYTTTTSVPERPEGCLKTKARIEAIFIEGHADFTHFRDLAIPNTPTPGEPRQLSSNQSSSNTNQDVRPTASDIARRTSEEVYKQRLRRIDLRILMATPRSEAAIKMQEELERTDIR